MGKILDFIKPNTEPLTNGSAHLRPYSQNSTIMTDSTKSSGTTKVVFAGNNNTVSGGELQNIQAAYRLNGKNYLKWSQLI